MKGYWAVLMVLALAVLFSVPANALVFKSGEKVILGEGDVINESMLAMGEEIQILGKVKGNLIAFGGRVFIDGNVGGTIIAAGGDVTILGPANSAVVGGGKVLINSTIKSDLVVGAGKVIIDDGAQVGKDTFLGCGEAVISGKICKDLRVGAGLLRLLPGAYIKGNLKYSAGRTEIDSGATIKGNIRIIDHPEAKKLAGYILTFAIAKEIIATLALILIGLLMLRYVPNQITMITNRMSDSPLKSLGWGVLSAIVIPVIAILLFITVVGIPLGLLLLIAFGFALYFSAIFIGIILGRWIIEQLSKGRRATLGWSLVLGLVIYKLITFIPIVGWVIALITIIWALGAIVTTRFVSYQMARDKEIL
ncbi:MAG: hypothetical protein V1843_03575 [bacterium]